MPRYEASFEVDSRSDAHAVERMVDGLYDAVREEVRTTRGESTDASELLDRFEAIREAARDHGPGTLTVVYEHDDDGFRDRHE